MRKDYSQLVDEIGPQAAHREQVKKLLKKHKSVSVVAAILGVTQPRLSEMLHRPAMRAWWLATKEKWRKDNAAARKRKWRKEARERYRRNGAERVLAERPLPSQWTPEDVGRLVDSGLISQVYGIALNSARASGRAKDFDCYPLGIIPPEWQT